MIARAGFVFMALALAPAVSQAAPIMVLSYGNSSCGSFIQADQQERQLFLAWVQGLISGANIADKGKGRMAGQGWDEAGATMWLQNYCTQNPLASFMTAATKLRVELGGNLVY